MDKYEAPKVIDLGSLEEFTQGRRNRTRRDNAGRTRGQRAPRGS